MSSRPASPPLQTNAPCRHSWQRALSLSAVGLPVQALLACVACAMLLLAGCDSQTSPGPRRGPAAQGDSQGGLFESVAENLEKLEQFDSEEIRKQICDRLNQWNLQEKPKVAWQIDPQVAALPEPLRNLLSVKALDSTLFQPNDAEFLQEAVWLRAVSSAARKDQFNDLGVAERLFDWTVRNIQLDSDSPDSPRHRVSQVLLRGRGTAIERAWLFMLLARQQGLNVVLLALQPDEAKPPRPWVCALLSGEELQLFDCNLGLPIPGPQEQGVATLSQVLADEQLLRRLDLDSEHPYPVAADDLKRIVAYVEASPDDLSRRMALVESRLSGKHKLVLTSAGDTLVEELKKVPHIADARLWTWPFEVQLWVSKLDNDGRKAAGREMLMFYALPEVALSRALYLKGLYDGDTGAKKHLLDMRPPEDFINNYKLPASAVKQFKKEDVSRIEAAQIVLMRQAKQSASYWLGLVMFQQEDYPPAIDYFAKRTLEASPDGPWTAGARYNLGRTYEATGETAKAIEAYESDIKSPQSHGNRLRARWLKDKDSASAGT